MVNLPRPLYNDRGRRRAFSAAFDDYLAPLTQLEDGFGITVDNIANIGANIEK